jgi:soluble lytic murein transglycosylase-like protein
MHRRVHVLLLAVLLVLTQLVPASTGGSSALANADLDAAERERAAVEERLEEVQRRLEAISAEIAEINDRLALATSELRSIRNDLRLAEEGIQAAEADEAIALERIAIADARLTELESELAITVERLQRRIVQTFKHGRPASLDIVLRGTVGALDLHEVAVTRATVERITDDDRRLVEAISSLASEQQELIASATAARVAAVAARDESVRQRTRIATLEEEQRRVVATIRADQARRQAVFDELEADRAALAALAAMLAERIRALRLGVANVVLPVGTVVSGVPSWASNLPAHGQPYAALIHQVAASEGLDGRIMAALIWTESSFRPNAVSRVGAAGLSQLMPATARSLGLRVDSSVDQRFDPEANVRAGARYLRRHIVNFGSVELGLAAYNAGSARVAQCRLGNPTPWLSPCTNQTSVGGIPPFTETQLYVGGSRGVLANYQRIIG